MMLFFSTNRTVRSLRGAALGLALLAGPAAAQSLPDWAAPKAPAASPAAPPMEALGPDMPGGPAEVPLDGGALLALAGAAYAARRLRRP